ncbi:hypothetical protein [uncultured Bacteroides sp.]|uniref:hypothetical protein n=1 Tax=uncultured Bacteroides sp. TaxID=162156 RepID=UPI00280A7964|nr:hypothetical protein [uncultured Bacteroides sp.]
MKRFASHYLFLPEAGYLKQQVVEVTDEGTIQRVFPLKEEMESVEWLPGVIALLTESEIARLENNECTSEIEYIFSLDLPHKPIVSPTPLLQEGGVAESRGGRCSISIENQEVMHSPTTSSYGYFSFLKEESGDTLVFKEALFPCLFYPFDFTSMQPVAETRHRLLR